VLVLTDLYWPDWHATVDGAPVEILRANHLLRAVHLSPGTHEVRFRYGATRFRVGAAVSVLTIGMLVVLWATSRRRT
jgi:uncharacterized membrane protein YfhO